MFLKLGNSIINTEKITCIEFKEGVKDNGTILELPKPSLLRISAQGGSLSFEGDEADENWKILKSLLFP
jgi:hypothetical protein